MPANPEFMADILWLRTTYYFGEHVLTDGNFQYLDDLLSAITDFAPKWRYPYLFAAVMIPEMTGDVGRGLYFIQKGIDNFPTEWRFRFYKGFYLMQYKKDYLAAAKSLNKASSMPGSPSYLSRLSASMATKAGQRKLAESYIRQALQYARSEREKKQLLEKLKEVLDGKSDFEVE